MKLELEHNSYFQRGDLLLGVRGSRFCGDIIRSQFVKEEGIVAKNKNYVFVELPPSQVTRGTPLQVTRGKMINFGRPWLFLGGDLGRLVPEADTEPNNNR